MKAFDDLKRLLSEGRIERREFIRRSTALGVAAAIPSLVLTEEARASEPKRGGRFRMAVRGGATSDSLSGGALLDSHAINTSWQVRNNLTEMLPDGTVAGELAESWEASADASTWVFNLRQGVEFHNGKTLDADDVVHSINLHRGPDSTSGASGVVAGITEVKADGKDKVVFTLQEGSADFPFLMSDYHLVVGIAGTEGPEWDKGIGTGPFMLTEWTPGVRSASKRNPNYFKEGRPWFDEVETLNVGDTEARVNALRTDETDAIEEPDLKTAHLLAQAPGVQIVEANGFKHFTFPMRTTRAPYDNNDVRLALKYAIDREAVLQTVLRGYGYVGNDHPIGRNQPYFGRDLEQRQYDPDKAKFHLKKAGMESLKVTLDAADIYAGGTDSGLLFKEHAAKAGIDIEIVQAPVDGFWSNVWMQKDFITSFWGGRPTSDWMFSVAYAEGAAWNDSYWSHERFNVLLKQGRAELDDAKRLEIYSEMQQICHDEGGVIVWGFGNWLLGVSDKIATPDAVAGNLPMDGDRAPERWWMA